jgi:hypothetical protein
MQAGPDYRPKTGAGDVGRLWIDVDFVWISELANWRIGALAD